MVGIENKRDVGREILKEVIGEDYFTRREASTNDFNESIRLLSEEVCFGTVWSRPGLPRATRSLLCIAMLIALNRASELRLHVQGALRNGCTVEEIKEVILQAMIYCGLPAAVDANRVAEEALREAGAL